MDIKVINHDINKFSNQKIRLKFENNALKKNKNLFPVKVYSFFSRIAQFIFGCKSISQHNLECSLKYANSLLSEKNTNLATNDISDADLEIKNIENTFKGYLNTNKGKNDKKRLEDLKYKLSNLDNKLGINKEDQLKLNLENVNNKFNVDMLVKEELSDENETNGNDVLFNLTHDYSGTNIEASVSNKENNTSNITTVTTNIHEDIEIAQTISTEFIHIADIIENLFIQQNNFGIDFIIELQCFFSLIFNKNSQLKIDNSSINKVFSKKLNNLQNIFLKVKDVKELNKVVLKKIVVLWVKNRVAIKESLSNNGNLLIYHIVDENIKKLQDKIDANPKSWNSLVPYYKAIINNRRIQEITNIRFLI